MSLVETYKEEFKENLERTRETGFVEKVTPPVVHVSGLPNVKSWEKVYFESGHMGVVTTLYEDYAEVMVLSNDPVPIGVQATRSGQLLKVPVGEGLLGNAVDALGNSIYKNRVISGIDEERRIDTTPLGIDKRERVKDPMITGVALVDFLIPLGKGQRELVIGDRNTGKTAFVSQCLLSQAREGTICIYAAVGKKKRSIKFVEEYVKRNNIQDSTIIVASSASDPIGYIYFTPYTAMTIAEYFRDRGKDVLLILDDLTSHARYYREMSLISGKFPGRDSYPGGVFHAHSRLLERAGNFKIGEHKSASITCLPIAETVEGDMTGYIQTNLMSITDGHIFFDQEMYRSGRKPSINYFLSVTRVGRQTQSGVRWGVSRELSSFFYLHRKTERFIHFGAELNESIKTTLEMGKRVDRFFDQTTEEIYSLPVQLVMFTLIWAQLLKDMSQGKIYFYKTQAEKLYGSDSKFKDKVDNLIESCSDFNSLLGKVSAGHKELIDYMETKQ